MAICAVLSSLGVMLMYLGSFIEVLDLSVALLASLVIVVLVFELGRGYPWMVYAITALLSLLLLPNKYPAIVYACFMGFYPIIKIKVERIRIRVLRWIIKLSVFNASVLLAWLVGSVFVGDVTFGLAVEITFALLNAIFVFYDYALSVMSTAYLRIWRYRLRIHRFFDK